MEFTQADLAADSVFYVHTSSSEMYMDKFIFAVTDGTNEVSDAVLAVLSGIGRVMACNNIEPKSAPASLNGRWLKSGQCTLSVEVQAYIALNCK